ncbi:hypothetical protein [Nocardia sp. CY41]|uniref:hypothetical protein n=1 Tax=Nocardia sp. CY41 TaxID=2608686 RepID=UPI001F2FC721|nr:hypothetical protein [Nocardia sp. CY41]
MSSSPGYVRPRTPLRAVRQRLVAALQEAAGPGLTAEAAQNLLKQARAWSSAARQLDNHLAEHPDAFIAPQPDCPLALPKLLKLLTANGFGDKVVLLGCARCGRTELPLLRLAPEGRCCPRCLRRTEQRPCARCGAIGNIAARRAEGSICHKCYRREPERQLECAGCGRFRDPVYRAEDGSVLCRACYTQPLRACVHCGQLQPTRKITDKGPVCRRCYTPEPRLCGICGEMRPIQRRGDDQGNPEICQRCYRFMGDCANCGKHSHGGHYRGGPFLCTTCWPRPARLCAICGKQKKITVTWPLGEVCNSCYCARLIHPAPCAECGTTRILVCVNHFGNVCTRCGGVDLDFTCKVCGEEGPGFHDGRCERCFVAMKIDALLSDENGTPIEALRPLGEALATANPRTVKTWLTTKTASRLLADLIARHTEFTHAELDKLPQNGHTKHLRELLVTTGILPRRKEALAQLQIWTERTLPALPAHQQRLIRPYADWHVLRRARRKAARGKPYRQGADLAARQAIGCAIKFLTWLDTVGTPSRS